MNYTTLPGSQLWLVLILAVCSQAFKLPVDLKRSIGARQDASLQLNLRESESVPMSAARNKVLAFPERLVENEDLDYPVQLFFQNQDEKEIRPLTDDNAGLERFYKYSIKTQPREGESIVFPKDVAESSNPERPVEASRKPIDDDIVAGLRSDGNLYENSDPSIILSERQRNANNTNKYNTLSLETLAEMVRQILFRGTSTPRYSLTTKSAIDTYDTSSELNVQDQSLYAGPQLKPQSPECPDGMKKNRNGYCQKPSRRLAT